MAAAAYVAISTTDTSSVKDKYYAEISSPYPQTTRIKDKEGQKVGDNSAGYFRSSKTAVENQKKFSGMSKITSQPGAPQVLPSASTELNTESLEAKLLASDIMKEKPLSMSAKSKAEAEAKAKAEAEAKAKAEAEAKAKAKAEAEAKAKSRG